MGLQQVLREGRRPCDASWGLTSNVWVEQSWATPGCSTPLIDGPTSAGAMARGAFLAATIPVQVCITIPVQYRYVCVGWPCVGVWWPGCVRWVARAPCPVFCNHIAAWLYTPRIHGEKPRRRAGPRAAQHEHGRRRNKRKFRRQGRLWSLDVDESMHAR